MRSAWPIVLLLALVPSASGQAMLGAASIAVNLNEADHGAVGAADDNCWVLDMDAAPTAGATRHDLRLTPCFGHAPGTEIRDTDVDETTAAYPQANGGTAEGVRYADVNSNGRYDEQDYVYITSAAGAGPGLVRTTGTGAWTLRLTGTGPAHGGFAAGTLVLAGDADCAAYCGSAPGLVASIGWSDGDSTVTYTAGDFAYLIPRPAGEPAGALVPPGSVRLNAAAGSPPPEATPTSTAATTAPPTPGMAAGSSSEAPGNAPEHSDGEARGTPVPASAVLLGLAVAVARRTARRAGPR